MGLYILLYSPFFYIFHFGLEITTRLITPRSSSSLLGVYIGGWGVVVLRGEVWAGSCFAP